jgi:ABC-type Na+ efflux pump permease subunit
MADKLSYNFLMLLFLLYLFFFRHKKLNKRKVYHQAIILLVLYYFEALYVYMLACVFDFFEITKNAQIFVGMIAFNLIWMNAVFFAFIPLSYLLSKLPSYTKEDEEE